jgi:cell wall-associated NlpC family hydrolase
MPAFDPRLTPARADLAAKHLEGKVQAACFVEGRLYEVIEPQAPLRREPRPDASLDTEALKGECVTIYDANGEGWAWGQLAADGYVGWLPDNALAPLGAAPTHKVTALRTLVFPGPSIKLPPLEALPLGARLAIARTEDRMAVTPSGAYVPAAHLAPLDWNETDFVAVAERFLGAPYLWGGKTGLGLDCSGLVQVALTACGVSCPRDSDMQEAALGTAVAAVSLERGDLIFWKGHVAIVRDRDSLIHANAYHMAVAIEPVADAVARIRGTGSKIASVRRIARA